MKFNSDKMAFGRHSTFALRYGWLSKGFQAVKSNGLTHNTNTHTEHV